MKVDRFKMEFNGKEYNAVELNGECVGLDTIIIAENSLNDAIEEAMDNYVANINSNASECDNQIFGFADIDMIINGSFEELSEYAKSLL